MVFQSLLKLENKQSEQTSDDSVSPSQLSSLQLRLTLQKLFLEQSSNVTERLSFKAQFRLLLQPTKRTAGFVHVNSMWQVISLHGCKCCYMNPS